MLTLSGNTVKIQAPGICAPLTQSLHTLYLTDTKSEIHPAFLGPMNNEAPCNCTHCGSHKQARFSSSNSRVRNKN